MDDCSTWCNKARVGALEKKVWKSIVLYIEEIFFHMAVSSFVTRYTPPCGRAKQCFTFLVTPSIKKSRVVQSKALYD